ncbi:unnamed protein product [Effrenium voratum]|nr:unnamed protein product [Effrenium voratum]
MLDLPGGRLDAAPGRGKRRRYAWQHYAWRHYAWCRFAALASEPRSNGLRLQQLRARLYRWAGAFSRCWAGRLPAETLLSAVNNGVQRAMSTEGLREEDVRWVEQQGSHISALASGGINLLSRSGWVREFLEQQLGRDWQTQQSGLDAGSISKWLEEREIPAATVAEGSAAPMNLKPGEAWSCSICLAGCSDAEGAEQPICLLCDSDGNAWHVFHKACAAEWLQRSATCPLCRRQLTISP